MKSFNISITVEDFVLEHMEETNKEFDEYLTVLSKCDDYTKIYYFLEIISKEVKSSQKIEKHYVKNKDILENDCFFTSLQMCYSIYIFFKGKIIKFIKIYSIFYFHQ